MMVSDYSGYLETLSLFDLTKTDFVYSQFDKKDGWLFYKYRENEHSFDNFIFAGKFGSVINLNKIISQIHSLNNLSKKFIFERIYDWYLPDRLLVKINFGEKVLEFEYYSLKLDQLIGCLNRNVSIDDLSLHIASLLKPEPSKISNYFN